eukprot:TRINITY_DN49647_c0_g1_i1.p1 TRINITY_DN49647_c0_g1~~TRINITY_DN49647_c0_g1_i1.p1  ORF type:complete len:511 (-),score=58.08 TRINITY_DN49647_c0_g1_i1:429-1961(-)
MESFSFPVNATSVQLGSAWSNQSVNVHVQPGIANVRFQAPQTLNPGIVQPADGSRGFPADFSRIGHGIAVMSYMATPVQISGQHVPLCNLSALKPAGAGNSCDWVCMMPVVSMNGSTHGLQPIPSGSSSSSPPNCQEDVHETVERRVSFASTTASSACAENGDSDVSAQPIENQNPLQRASISASAARRKRRQRAAAAAKAQERDERGISYECVQSPVVDVTTPKRFLNHGVVSASRQSVASTWNDRVIKQLETGGEDMRAAVAELHGRVRSLAFDVVGCRVLQTALRMADQRDVARLAGELQGCVRSAIASSHGNYVVQAVVEVLPPVLARFVVDEVKGVGAETARHKYGCRVMCRLLEHSATDLGTIALIDETLRQAPELCRHDFGHHVMESVLEHGQTSQKQCVVFALASGLPKTVVDDNSTFVVNSALRHCEKEDQHILAAALLNNPECVFELAKNRCGYSVVRSLLRLPRNISLLFRRMLENDVARIKKCERGSRILHEMRMESS